MLGISLTLGMALMFGISLTLGMALTLGISLTLGMTLTLGFQLRFRLIVHSCHIIWMSCNTYFGGRRLSAVSHFYMGFIWKMLRYIYIMFSYDKPESGDTRPQ